MTPGPGAASSPRACSRASPAGTRRLGDLGPQEVNRRDHRRRAELGLRGLSQRRGDLARQVRLASLLVFEGVEYPEGGGVLTEREPGHCAVFLLGQLLRAAQHRFHLVGILRLGHDAYQQTDLHVITPRVKTPASRRATNVRWRIETT